MTVAGGEHRIDWRVENTGLCLVERTRDCLVERARDCGEWKTGDCLCRVENTGLTVSGGEHGTDCGRWRTRDCVGLRTRG